MNTYEGKDAGTELGKLCIEVSNDFTEIYEVQKAIDDGGSSLKRNVMNLYNHIVDAAKTK